MNGILYTEMLGPLGFNGWNDDSSGGVMQIVTSATYPTSSLHDAYANSPILQKVETIGGGGAGTARHIRALASGTLTYMHVGTWNDPPLQTTAPGYNNSVGAWYWFDAGPVDPGQAGQVNVRFDGNVNVAEFFICASDLLTINGLAAGQVVKAYRASTSPAMLIGTATCQFGNTFVQIDLTNEAFPESIYLEIYGTDGVTIIEATPDYTMGGGDQWSWQAPAAAMTATASSFIIYPNGTGSVITVTLTEANGEPYVGVPVTFSTTLGTLSAASVVTNSQGQASTTLRSSMFGIAVVQCNWEGDQTIPAATAYVTVHVFYGQEFGDSTKPFQMYVEGYPLLPIAGTYTVNYRMVPGQFQIQIPKWDPNIVANGLVGIYRYGVKEYGGVLQRIERVLGDQPTVTLSGVDFAVLMNTRVIDSDLIAQMAPQTAISYLLKKYFCGITPGNLQPYYPTMQAVGGGVVAATVIPPPSIVQGPVRGTLANIPNPQSPENVLTVSLNTTPTTLDLLVLTSHSAIFSGSSPSPIVTITQPGVVWYRVAGPVNTSGGSEATEIWAGQVGPNADTTITITYGASPNPVLAVVDVCEWNNLATTVNPVLDQTATDSSSVSVTAGNTGSTPQTTFPVELVVGCVGATASSPAANQPAQPVGQTNPNLGFTLLDGNPLSVTYDVPDVGTETFSVSNAYLFQVVSKTGAYGATTAIAGSASMTGCVATFKAIAATYTPSVISQQFQTETLQAAVQAICKLVGWVYRVNPDLSLDFAPQFGRGLVPVSFTEGQNLLTCQTITDYSTEVTVLHVKGSGVSTIATDETSLAEVGLLESTDLQTSISDQTTLNLAAVSALNSLQNAALVTITLEGDDNGAPPGTFLPEDQVTITSPTLTLSGGFQIAQITRDVGKPVAYCNLQLNGLLREFLLLDQTYWRILHDLAVGVGAVVL